MIDSEGRVIRGKGALRGTLWSQGAGISLDRDSREAQDIFSGRTPLDRVEPVPHWLYKDRPAANQSISNAVTSKHESSSHLNDETRSLRYIPESRSDSAKYSFRSGDPQTVSSEFSMSSPLQGVPGSAGHRDCLPDKYRHPVLNFSERVRCDETRADHAREHRWRPDSFIEDDHHKSDGYHFKYGDRRYGRGSRRDYATSRAGTEHLNRTSTVLDRTYEKLGETAARSSNGSGITGSSNGSGITGRHFGGMTAAQSPITELPQGGGMSSTMARGAIRGSEPSAALPGTHLSSTRPHDDEPSSARERATRTVANTTSSGRTAFSARSEPFAARGKESKMARGTTEHPDGPTRRLEHVVASANAFGWDVIIAGDHEASAHPILQARAKEAEAAELRAVATATAASHLVLGDPFVAPVASALSDTPAE